jgi:peptidoglycan/LPS O-acetylase OafA/YrhL
MSSTSETKRGPEPQVQPPGSWLSRLSRVTTSGRFVPEIDGFRFIAILSVFLLHDMGQIMAKNGVGVGTQRRIDWESLAAPDYWLASVLWAGGFGVSLFFVISGFVLALPFAEHHLLNGKKPAIKAYLLRRLTRLEPPFITNLLIQSVVLYLYYRWNVGEALRHFIATMFYVHNQVYGELSIINGVTWSLEIEVQFYLLVPLLAQVFSIRNTVARRMTLAAVILAIGILNDAFAPNVSRYHWSLAYTLHYFLAGFFLADIFLINSAFLLKRKHLLWDVVAILAAGVMLAGVMRERTDPNVPGFYLPWCILLFYIAGFKSVLFNGCLTSRPIFLIGGMCYTIYLYHGLVLNVVAVITRPFYIHSLPYWANFPIQCAIHSALAMLICGPLFFFIERPCMRRDWPQRLWPWLVHRMGRKNVKVS